MVTLNDIAERTGVTVATVSNALRNRGRVAEQTRARILAVAEELGYEVNLRARHLRIGRTDTIAFIAPSFHDYFSGLADEIAVEVEAGRRHLVLERTAARTENEREAISLTRLQMFDGVLLSTVGLDREDIARAQSRVPLVVLSEREMPATVDHVMLANEDGARLATAHMIDGGARNIVVLGGSTAPDLGIASSRRAGWEAAHSDAGIVADPRLIVPLPDFSMHDAREAVRRLLRDGVRFDAVFAVTDVVALGAMSALTGHGCRIPQDIQVAGFDNIATSDYLSPGLTSVDPDHRGVAHTAMRLLARRIAGDPGPAEHIVVPVSLVVRGSTRAR
ncbi:LacI family DNA-binding transcriptional regulator [Occultella gossypii]|uniref:LacI family DNA-binding transcriptional regulator n=1 Tax=Occultella gossypii TaxID=2800820 RepID=A0ABS7S917_9MICO|nr:LacI family DNA-binding transcriptional regulator [Occultella gossypii]MBZ2195713.1 LacI family DNA-binding transcriptional regulator [Occultella gossypii]